MVPVAPQRQWVQGAHRKPHCCAARMCNAADAAFAGQPFGQGRKKPHSHLAQAASMGCGTRLLIRQALFVNLARAEVSKPLDGLKLNGIGTLQ